MVSISDDSSVSNSSELVVYRPPPHSFPQLSATLLGAIYSPLNFRVLHVQPTSALLAWDAPLSHSPIEVYGMIFCIFHHYRPVQGYRVYLSFAGATKPVGRVLANENLLFHLSSLVPSLEYRVFIVPFTAHHTAPFAYVMFTTPRELVTSFRKC